MLVEVQSDWFFISYMFLSLGNTSSEHYKKGNL